MPFGVQVSCKVKFRPDRAAGTLLQDPAPHPRPEALLWVLQALGRAFSTLRCCWRICPLHRDPQKVGWAHPCLAQGWAGGSRREGRHADISVGTAAQPPPTSCSSTSVMRSSERCMQTLPRVPSGPDHQRHRGRWWWGRVGRGAGSPGFTGCKCCSSLSCAWLGHSVSKPPLPAAPPAPYPPPQRHHPNPWMVSCWKTSSAFCHPPVQPGILDLSA